MSNLRCACQALRLCGQPHREIPALRQNDKLKYWTIYSVIYSIHPPGRGFSRQMSQNSIKLGLMPPLTGIVGLYGDEIVRAAKIAAEEVNEQGGVLGRRLELIIEDDASLPDTAVPAAFRLVDKGCSAIIGNLLSNSRIAVAHQVAEIRKIPYLNFSFYEGSIFSRYFFHFAALPNQQIEKMIPYMREQYGPKFFFAGSNYEWPLGSIAAAKAALAGCGGEVVGEEYLPIGSEKIAALLEKLKRSGADVFVPYFAGADQMNLLTGFTQLGLKRRMAVVMGHYDEAMVSHLPPDIREGFFSSNTYFMSVNTPANIRLLSRLDRFPGVCGIWPAGNGIVTNFGEGTYVCVKAFAAAANAAGSAAADALIGSLEMVRLSAPQGEVTMDSATHHAAVNSYLARCNRDGSFGLVERFGQIEPLIPDRYRKEVEARQISMGHRLSPEQIPGFAGLSGSTIPEQILALADIAIVAINTGGQIVYVNRKACELFRYVPGELMGKPLDTILPPRFRSAHGHHISAFLASEEPDRPMGRRNEICGYTKYGEEFPAKVSIAKINAVPEILLVASIIDLTEKRHMEEELTWKANHDSLTNLPNRRLIIERIGSALKRTLGTQREIALLFIDLDSFKMINDAYGHEQGDQLLVEAAERIVNTMRPGDILARFGGDEFILLCGQLRHQYEAIQIANNLVSALREKINIRGVDHYTSGSIGIAFGSGATHTAEELLKDADLAMYEAKAKGRDNWKIFTSDLQANARTQIEIANGLRTALRNGDIRAHFQPIFDISGQRLVGAELLSRWQHESKNIPPDLFVAIAEKNGIIHELGYFTLRQGCLAQVKSSNILAAGAQPYIAINISVKQLDDPGFAEALRDIVAETGADPQHIVLEITESSLMLNAEKNIETLTKIHKTGVRIAVDDFGTGYSSLSYLSKMPVSKIKIDKSFVTPIGAKHQPRTIVSAIIMMAKAMDFGVVAEGVETQEQLAILSELGCDHVQGYLFARPLTATQFFTLLTEIAPR